jgi:alanyl aminopeptidase
LLFSSGLGNLEQEFQMVSAFSKDADPNLIQQAAAMLRGVSELVPADSRIAYAARIEELFGKKAHELGWRPREADTPEIRGLRTALVGLVAGSGNDAELAAEARKLAEAWLKDRTSLEAEAVTPVLGTSAYSAGHDFFDELVAALRTTKIQRERGWIIAGIGSFRDAEIAKSALDLIGTPGIDPRETSRLLFAANAETRQTVWQYVQTNFDKLNQMLPGARGVPFGATLPGAVAGFCDAGRASEVEAFFKPRVESMPGGARNLATTLERIKLCAAQAEVARPVVAASLLRP